MKALLQIESSACLFVPLRDGVHLACDLYRPRAGGPCPGIVIRTPYGREGVQSSAETWAARGYAVLVADARGTGSSEGTYTYYNIADGLYDGYDLVEWLAHREFCDGNVGTTGGSALGIYQILTGSTRPPHLRAQCISSYPMDFYTDQWYPGGVFRSDNRLGWVAGIAGRTSHGAVRIPDGAAPPTVDRLRRLRATRYASRERELRTARLPGMTWASEYLDSPVRSPAWDAIDLTPHIRRIEVPVLHAGILFDHFGIGTIRGFELHPGEKRLVMLPGSLGFEGEQRDFPEPLEVQWFERFLKGRDVDAVNPRVMFYCTGRGRWLEFDELPRTREHTLRLTGDGGLQPPDAANAAVGEIVLTHDPARPALSAEGGGDFRTFCTQPGVAAFTSPPLDAETVVLGHPRLRLRVRTDAPDANLIAWFLAVRPDGSTRRLNFGARKLSLRDDLSRPEPVPAGPWMDVVVDLWTISHAFAPGDRMGLCLSLSDYPFFENAPHPGAVTIDTANSTLELPVLGSI